MPLGVEVSTQVFGAWILGSNPSRTTILFYLSMGSNPLEATDRTNYIFYCLFVVIMNNLFNL